MQNKHGWSDDKTERCIMKVKKKVGWHHHKHKKHKRKSKKSRKKR